ncbi:MAG TPA: hypothetical protein VFA55_04760, partial [Candidatus Kapabacteria bacterium]|nr:hypothetical protein [Candidatus Kapabacteria bacterium]
MRIIELIHKGPLMRSTMKVFICGILLCGIYSSVEAQWNLDPTVRNGIAVVDSQQQHPVVCTDDKGGAIIAWDDNRLDSIHTFVYAQRIDRYGYIRWQTNGMVVTQRFAGLQHNPMLASDGAGGAFIGWYDDSVGHNLYYDHIDSAGNIRWSTGTGVLLEHDTSALASPLSLVGIFNDGQQGAWLVWDRKHYGPARDSIFIKHVDQNNNVLFAPTLLYHFSQSLGFINAATNSNGDLFVGVTTPSTAGKLIFYLQKISQNGNVQWASPGIRVVDTNSSMLKIYLVGDLQGGVYAAWD